MTDQDQNGTDAHRGHVFFLGDEIVAEVWEAGPARLTIKDLPYDEFVTILEGDLVLTDVQGNVETYTVGESLVIPKGFSGIWQMIGNYRELVVVEKQAYLRAEGGE